MIGGHRLIRTGVAHSTLGELTVCAPVPRPLIASLQMLLADDGRIFSDVLGLFATCAGEVLVNAFIFYEPAARAPCADFFELSVRQVLLEEVAAGPCSLPLRRRASDTATGVQFCIILLGVVARALFANNVFFSTRMLP